MLFFFKKRQIYIYIQVHKDTAIWSPGLRGFEKYIYYKYKGFVFNQKASVKVYLYSYIIFGCLRKRSASFCTESTESVMFWVFFFAVIQVQGTRGDFYEALKGKTWLSQTSQSWREYCWESQKHQRSSARRRSVLFWLTFLRNLSLIKQNIFLAKHMFSLNWMAIPTKLKLLLMYKIEPKQLFFHFYCEWFA